MIWFLCYMAAIVAANLAISAFGLVPVGFGLVAPAGVYFAGVTFLLRDAVQETLGRRWTYAAILGGAGLSMLLTGPALGLASGIAFLVSETADLLVYTPLRARHLLAAVVLSNTAGAIVDSAVFLWLAFGSLDFLLGQVVGKLWVTVAFLPLVWLVARWRAVKAEAV